MALSYSAYNRMNADPKRSEAAKRGAVTRHRRDRLMEEWRRSYFAIHRRWPSREENRTHRAAIIQLEKVPPLRVTL